MKKCWLLKSVFVSMLVLLPLSAAAHEKTLLETPPPAQTSNKTDHSAASLLGKIMLSSGDSNNLFSQPPTLSSPYTLHGKTFIPYIGTGFGGGEPMDVNRTIIRQQALQSSIQEDRLLRDLVGKSLIPNEFHVGIRIPF